MESCLRKRKRDAGAGQLEQSNVVGLQEVPHPEWIDLSSPHGSHLPPGWEQFLDLQSGEMYYVNSTSQTRINGGPRCSVLNGQGNNGNCHLGKTLGFDLEMKLPSLATNVGMPGLPFGGKLPREVNGMCLNSSINSSLGTMNSEISMVATVCLHCHTFVMVSRQSPHCPNCKNLCNVDHLPRVNGQA